MGDAPQVSCNYYPLHDLVKKSVMACVSSRLLRRTLILIATIYNNYYTTYVQFNPNGAVANNYCCVPYMLYIRGHDKLNSERGIISHKIFYSADHKCMFIVVMYIIVHSH